MARSKIQPSTRRLSEVARHVVIPQGIVTTGWPAVESKCREFGVEFDEWQRGLGRVILGKRSDGVYASTIGGVTLSIPRQVAKTFLVARIVFALCALFPGTKVLWTAHRTRTATNTFKSLQGFCRLRKVAPYVASIRVANGEQEILFTNGSVMMFGAREAGFGRGFDEVDVEVFDEAQILTEKALEDMVAATNQSRHPHGALLFYMGTPPRPVDPGEVFAARRAEALSGGSVDAVYVECSADRDADPDDHAQWAKANASFPARTPLRSMLRLRKNLPSVDSWRREALGIWDEAANVGALRGWDALADPASRIASHHQWSLAVEPLDPEDPAKSRWASVGVAGRTEGGRLHVEWMKHDEIVKDDGSEWIEAYIVGAWQAKRIPIRIRPNAPEGAFIAPLREKGVEVDEVSGPDTARATEQLINAVRTKALVHIGQRSLDVAVHAAVLRAVGDATTWAQRPRRSGQSPSIEITPLMAVTVALGGVPVAAEPEMFFAVT